MSTTYSYRSKTPFPETYCHSKLALWRFHTADGLKQHMFMECEVLDHAAATARWVGKTYTTPPTFTGWGPYTHEPEEWDIVPELARIMWGMSPDFYTIGEFYRTDTYLRRRNHDVTTEASFVWDVWGSDLKAPLEGAFKMHNADRTVEPFYDLDRRPWDELVDALAAGWRMNQAIQQVT